MRARKYSYWLILFLGLFIFRVVAQFIQLVYPVTFLPVFEVWQSGALPYPVLLFFQLAIIVFCIRVIYKFRSGSLQPNNKTGLILLIIGAIYFGIMAFRLVAGFSFAVTHPWLGVHLPAIFHIVLALFILAVGFFHSPHTDKIMAWLSYPSLMLFALIGHYLCVYNNANFLLATYVPIFSAALIITLLELNFPHRKDWKAVKNDVFNDGTYMIFVQILLPKFLGFFVVLFLLEVTNKQGLAINNFWPYEWPIYLQAILMLCTAEFLRYWMHRLAHVWIPLWKFHAVHHSPHKLYWFNVGRFHPVEKTLQFMFDALPFIVLGVSKEVMALYFVFYAINGFFQHSNIEVRLGFLNYFVSGPELHRWHHSKLLEESNNNYGNNLIIWDLLFGTRFLPKGRVVGELGLINHEYPQSLIGQLIEPFKKA